MDEMMGPGNARGDGTRKTRNTLRKRKNLFPELKKVLWKPITRLHTEDTNMKIYITACKYSFGEEVHISPVKQTETVFVPIWEKKHQRLTEQKNTVDLFLIKAVAP